MTHKLNILYLLPAEGFGGAERQGLLHAARLPECDVDVTLVTGPGNIIRQTALRMGIKDFHWLSSLPAEYGKPFALKSWFHYAFTSGCGFFRSWWELRLFCRQRHFDLIVSTRALGLILGATLSWSTARPYVWRSGSRIHGTFIRTICKGILHLHPPQLLLANCTAVAENLRDLFSGELHLLPNAVDVWAFRPSERPEPTQAVIGIAARPSPDKGIAYLIDVVQGIHEQHPDIQFLFAGEYGWRKQIMERFHDLGLQGQIQFLGHVDDMAKFYRHCQAILLTSRERSVEGFPNALLEAMACGCPVVATAVGGIPELISSPDFGLLVSPSRPQDAVNALHHLLHDPKEAHTMGLKAREFVCSHYDAAVIARRFALELENAFRKSLP
ncbi:MAG TPA: glycosyltransferase family 4 protein [Fibrobacteraceae bacterium]|nr:glycosyltransferase family 4 protein [Fibrobacteraceae bacterium]